MSIEEKRDHFAERMFTKLVSALNGIGTIWIFVMMVLINLDVFMRYLFNQPVKGVPLVITMSIVGIVFLQLTDALRAGRFTRSDAVIGPLLSQRPRIGHSLQMIFNALGAFLMSIFFWYTIPFLVKDWSLNSYAGNEGEFTIPEWPIRAIIVIGSACCCIQFVRHFWEDIRALRGKYDHDHMGAGGTSSE